VIVCRAGLDDGSRLRTLLMAAIYAICGANPHPEQPSIEFGFDHANASIGRSAREAASARVAASRPHFGA